MFVGTIGLFCEVHMFERTCVLCFVTHCMYARKVSEGEFYLLSNQQRYSHPKYICLTAQQKGILSYRRTSRPRQKKQKVTPVETKETKSARVYPR